MSVECGCSVKTTIRARHLFGQHSAGLSFAGPSARAQANRIPASPMPKTSGHAWRFKARFRRHAFGWKSQPAIARLQEALSEITLVARIDPMLGAEGAVALLQRISPALENVDSSSAAIGTAVNHTIAELVPGIFAAPPNANTRAPWPAPLYDTHPANPVPHTSRL